GAAAGPARPRRARGGGGAPPAPPHPEAMQRRIAAGTVWLWEDADGEAVHLLGATTPAFGVVRIGPVYTPPAQRGRGWASNAVAEISRRTTLAGVRACLFTDQANPTSNAIYQALGYRAVTDTANLVRRR
ncbi:MAG: acetyltransferase, partial [Nocardioides sp.]|nr:acetyltransferase [Nocardioides sp.]